MQLHSHRRKAMASCRCIVAVIVLSLGPVFFLVFTRVPPGDLVLVLPLQVGAATPGLFVPSRRLPLAVRGVTTLRSIGVRPADEDQAVLLPNWEVLVLLRCLDGGMAENATCSFGGGASSPARALGRLPASGHQAYVCVIPGVHDDSASSLAVRAVSGLGGAPEMLRWSDRLVYYSTVDKDGDVLVFAKGINPRQGVNRAAADIRCVYYGAGADDVVTSLSATTSAQQVFRCPPPPKAAHPSSSAHEVRVTLAVKGEDPIPSLAVYISPASSSGKKKVKKTICACTMVLDKAKFLREWVVYHAAVGMERFYIYDNRSEDDLAEQVRLLGSAGYDVSVVVWPWTKAQEAGFSHSAAAHRDSCEWMAFIDIDEFIFSPRWMRSKQPSPSMLRSVIFSVEPDVGQVSLRCADFGPSGQTAHPREGVTQGYTCRRRTMERHKSLVRLNAVDRSLLNSVHHFVLGPGFREERITKVRVNHYKYQAWEEFKVKFRRRVTTYVADWTEPVNLASKDRTPGLGLVAVQPIGWANMFCDMNDTLLRDATRRWFGSGFDVVGRSVLFTSSTN